MTTIVTATKKTLPSGFEKSIIELEFSLEKVGRVGVSNAQGLSTREIITRLL